MTDTMSPGFQVLAQIVRDQSGIVLTADKSYLVESRLRPVARKHDFPSVEALAESLRAWRDAIKINDVVDAMTTNESFFFRDNYPFHALRERLLPRLAKARAQTRRLRIWSAAASSGQEAYSIAMLLAEWRASPPGCALDNWAIEILGTDISREMVERARVGIYAQHEIERGLSAALREKYFTRTGDKWRIVEPLRRIVRFEQRNLLHDNGALGVFDVVFCRNVLIYFDLPTKARVLAAIARMMPDDGCLVLGGAETILGISQAFQAAPGVAGVYAPVR
jgi:chemotaxis protein methyltransferase CheR